MISNFQKPIDSGFHAKSNSNDIVQNIDLVGKKAIITGGYSGIGLARCFAGQKQNSLLFNIFVTAFY